ncbi:MAG: hypothetical protein ACYTG5_11715 [Planctomycetota bacterium]|jgi:hypothetical protein
MTEEHDDMPDLEPIAEAAPAAAPAASAPTRRPGLPGLPPPAFNPTADKEYYRFQFAGLIMFVGCLMPFGPEWDMNGYKTMSGAFFLLISIGMIWSWWGAIHTARFSGKNLRWVGLCFIPFIVELFNLISAFDEPAVRAMVAAQAAAMEGDVIVPIAADWGEVWAGMTDFNNTAATEKVGNFFRAFGTGKVVVFVGAFLAELFMLLAVFGGAKAAKQQKAAKQAERTTKGSRGSGRRR